MSGRAETRQSGPAAALTAFFRSPKALRALVILAVAAVLFGWYSWPRDADPELVSVAAPRLAEHRPEVEFTGRVTQTGRFGSYKLTFHGVAARRDVSAVVTVNVKATGPEVSSIVVYYGSGRGLLAWAPLFILSCVVACFLFFRVIPGVFGRKCPRHGCLLTTSETVVYPPSWDPGGLSRASIIHRTYSCPQCDFRHVQALLDPHHRPTSVMVDGGARRHFDFEVVARMRERRREQAVTDEEFAKMLADARQDALEKTSPDSPWR